MEQRASVFKLARTANSIAALLIADLRSGRFEQIGLHEIDQACDREDPHPRDREQLVTMTCRRVCEMAGGLAPGTAANTT